MYLFLQLSLMSLLLFISSCSSSNPDSTNSPLSRALPPQADAMIVFGASVRPSGQPSASLKLRLDHAAALYKDKRASIIVLSGSSESHYNEPLAMKNYLLTQGIPSSAFILDFNGDNTWDSILNMTALAKQYHWQTMIGISQEFHLNRIALTAEKTSPLHWYYSAPFQAHPSPPKLLRREKLALLMYKVRLLSSSPSYKPPLNQAPQRLPSDLSKKAS